MMYQRSVDTRSLSLQPNNVIQCTPTSLSLQAAVWHNAPCSVVQELYRNDFRRIPFVLFFSPPGKLADRAICFTFRFFFWLILWRHSGPLCHALSLLSLSSLSSLLWTSMRRRRATVATPSEWQCKTGSVRRLAVANGPNIFQMLLFYLN